MAFSIGDSTTGQEFQIVVFSPGFYPGFRGGGPIRSVTNLVREAPKNIHNWVVTPDRDLGSTDPYPGLSGKDVDYFSAKVTYLPARIGAWVAVLQSVRANPPDVIYINSLFNRAFGMLPLLAWRIGLLPSRYFLIAPRGELHPGALGIKPIRKSLAKPFLLLAVHDKRVLWHACADSEAAHISAWAPSAPSATIIVCPNMVNLPRESIPATEINDPQKLRAVFIGRISRKKGLSMVLQALGSVTGPACLDIYGPIEDPSYWRECERLAADLPSNVETHYCGELIHSEVPQAFASSDVFVFPTMGENFGHVIAEALFASCPVLLPDTTPWTDTILTGGGWIAEGTAEGFGEVLEALSHTDATERLESRRRAGQAYDRWRKETTPSHLFELVQDRCIPIAGNRVEAGG